MDTFIGVVAILAIVAVLGFGFAYQPIWTLRLLATFAILGWMYHVG